MELRTRKIEIACGVGRMPAYKAEPPSGGPHSAVIVLMEAFGLVPNLEQEVDRIARMGYVAIAPDVHHRQAPDHTAAYDDLPKAIGMLRKLKDAELVDDLKATIAHLRSAPEVGRRRSA